MLGTVSANAATWPRLATRCMRSGSASARMTSISACAGLRTMGVRLAHHHQAGLKVARWLASAAGNRARAPSGARELSRPRHLAARFLRRERAVQHRVQAGRADGGQRLPQRAQPVRHRRVVGRLREPGHSVRLHAASARRPKWAPGGPTVRLHIGLEDVDDLIGDLERGFAALAAAR